MRITIVTSGSRGDVQPFVALALGLRAAGHQVKLATSRDFDALVREHGVEFAPIPGNIQELLGSERGRALLGSSRNPIAFAREMKRLIEPVMDEWATGTWDACQGAEAVIYSFSASAGYHAAEKLGVPSVLACLQPVSPTRAFPSPFSPVHRSLGGALNWASHVMFEQALWLPMGSLINRWRRETLALPPISFPGYFDELRRRRHLQLHGVSPTVIPRPSDWGDFIHVTGYWFLDRSAGWAPPPRVLDFLGSGPRPVYIGFGSMIDADPEALTALAVKALGQARRRGILLGGWGGLGEVSLPDDVLKVDAIPHDWLFPQMTAVVHHGGAGTTAAGLRAGVPSIVVPYFADQPFWANRVHLLGAGPRPILRKHLTAARLAEAITRAVTDQEMQRRAAEVGRRIRAEDGVARAVEIFGRAIATPR